MTRKDTRTGDRHTSVGRLVRAPQELWDALDAAAEREGVSATEAVRQAVAEWSLGTNRPTNETEIVLDRLATKH